MLARDTIVAISTPPGRGGIGIVRLSGPEARQVAEPMLRLRRPLEAGRARFAEVVDPEGGRLQGGAGGEASGEVLDQAVVTYFEAPHSSTGEDVVEIAAHGSPVLLRHLLTLCLGRGARLAEPGEFTQRGFLNGRMDLTQAEAVHDLIEASTMHQARTAARQMGGSLSHALAPVKAELVGLIAALEAGIDFAEDDIDTLPGEAIAERLGPLEARLSELAKSFAYGRVLRDGFTLAIVGRPNAGKSSLFNRLVERDRAIVTATPGTTRDTIAERLALEGIPLELIDTAGLRSASDSFASASEYPIDEAESLGMARSQAAIAEADLILLVRDASQPVTEEDAKLRESLRGPEKTQALLVVENKCDLMVGRELAEAQEAVWTSALTGEGIAELRQAILDRISGPAPAPESAMLTNVRQHQAIAGALEAMGKARSAATLATPHEMLLLDLYEALGQLDSLTGATTPDDILHLIFSTFCIGK